MALAKHKKKPKFMNNILDELYHENKPLCYILPTSSTPKPDAFKLLRPKSNTCLDYNISQTDTKLDAGHTKIHIQQTEATYVPNDKPPPKPKTHKKTRYFSGGPPQWEFCDEKIRRKIEEKQKIYREQLAARLAVLAEERRKSKKRKKKSTR